MSVDFHAKHRALLEQAIDALGWQRVDAGESLVVRSPQWGQMTLDLAAQRATLRTADQDMLNRLKQQYSMEAIKRAAKLQGWQVKTKGQMKGVLRR